MLEVNLKRSRTWRACYWLADQASDDWRNPVPTNLCPFMRRVLGGLVLTGGAAFVLAVCLLAALLGSYTILIGPLLYHLGIIGVSGLVFSEVSVLAAFATLGVSLGMFIAASDKFFKDLNRKIGRWISNNAVAELENKEPSPLAEWIKAKHDKVCPEIEFKRE